MILRDVCIALGWQGGTIHQVKTELIRKVNDIYRENSEGPGKRVDLAIEMLRGYGVDASDRGRELTVEILSRSLYGQEPPGSVTDLVCSLR